MSFRRYEITLPIRYNDGTPIEAEKLLRTRRESGARFGALTLLPQPVLGEWRHEGIRFEDINLRILVDVEDTAENAEFFLRFKQTLKERFRQVDIWIVSYQIQIT